MKISRVKIKNYRNFEDFDINLKNFTLIIGENNIGKTNFLNALGLIFSQDISFYKKRFLEVEDINFSALEKFKTDVISDKPIEDIKPLEVIVEVYITDFKSKEHRSIVADWLIDKELKTAKLTYKFSFRSDFEKWVTKIRVDKNQNIDFPISDYESKIYGGDNDSQPVDNYFLKMIRFDFLDALRDAKSQLVASGESKILYKILSNLEGNSLSDIKNVLADLSEIVDKNTALQSIKKEIGDFLKKTSLVQRESMNKVEFLFSSIEESEIIKKLEIIYGENPLKIERNGLGRNNLLYISLVLSHLIASKKNNAFFRIIAIEEPEAHLHPNLQEHLSKSLQELSNDELQIVLTSHSAHITSNLDLENTLVLFNDESKIKGNFIVDNFSPSKDDINSIRYLRRFLDATKSTMFFAKKIILVEGIAEQTVIPALFAKKYGSSIEQYGVVIVNVNGVAFEHFLKIISKNLFLRTLVLTDSDSGTKNSGRADTLISTYKEILHIKIQKTQTSTFEKDLIESNLDKDSIETLLKAIKMTRPTSGGDTFQTKFRVKPNIDDFFTLIEEKDDSGKKKHDFKSEFATNLVEVLSIEENKFNIPDYIRIGFEFLIGEKNDSN